MVLPVTTDLYAHWEADSLAFADGENVTSWVDSVTGNEFTNTGGSAHPTCETNSQNGMRGVKFAGAQRIADVVLGGTPPSTKTIFLVLKNPPNDGTKKTIWTQATTVARKWTNADRWIWGYSESNFMEFTESGIAGVAGIWTYAHQQTGAFIRWNQVQKATVSLNAPLADSYIILSEVDNSGVGTTFYEIAVYTGILSAGDIDLVEDYLFDKWFAIPQPEFEVEASVESDVAADIVLETDSPPIPPGDDSNRIGGGGAIRRHPTS